MAISLHPKVNLQNPTLLNIPLFYSHLLILSRILTYTYRACSYIALETLLRLSFSLCCPFVRYSLFVLLFFSLRSLLFPLVCIMFNNRQWQCTFRQSSTYTCNVFGGFTLVFAKSSRSIMDVSIGMPALSRYSSLLVCKNENVSGT